MSASPLLFPYLDVAMRLVAVLIICALPVLLVPLPAAQRRRSRITTTD